MQLHDILCCVISLDEQQEEALTREASFTHIYITTITKTLLGDLVRVLDVFSIKALVLKLQEFCIFFLILTKFK